LEGLGIENVVIFYDLLEYFTAIWYNLQPFGIDCGHLVYFFRFGTFGQNTNLATLLTVRDIWPEFVTTVVATVQMFRQAHATYVGPRDLSDHKVRNWTKNTFWKTHFDDKNNVRHLGRVFILESSRKFTNFF
jgi:hypothetical protein